MNQKRGSIVPSILAGIAIVLIVAVLYWKNQNKISQNQTGDSTEVKNGEESKNIDPTANWKTFNDFQLGFELKYPPTWSLTPGPNYGRIVVFREEPVESTSFFSIEALTKDLEVSLKDEPDVYDSKWNKMGNGYLRYISYRKKRLTLYEYAKNSIGTSTLDTMASTFKFTK